MLYCRSIHNDLSSDFIDMMNDLKQLHDTKIENTKQLMITATQKLLLEKDKKIERLNHTINVNCEIGNKQISELQDETINLKLEIDRWYIDMNKDAKKIKELQAEILKLNDKLSKSIQLKDKGLQEICKLNNQIKKEVKQ